MTKGYVKRPAEAYGSQSCSRRWPPGVLSTTRTAVALPSFAHRPACRAHDVHTVAYGPALTAYGRPEFKLNSLQCLGRCEGK